MEQDTLGYGPELWRKMEEQGWMGLALPERYGGVGLGFMELALLLEEMGRVLLPGPFFPTTVLAATAILEAGNGEQHRRWLPYIADGSLVATFAFTEPGGRWDAAGVQMSATRMGTRFVLKGKKLFVPDAHVAGLIVVAARTGHGISLFLVQHDAPRLSRMPMRTIAGDRVSEVVFDGVVVPPEALLGEAGGGWPVAEAALRRGAAGLCAWMVGGMERVLDMTLRYAGQRAQFGKPVGSFQVIQHRCADMAVDVETSRTLAYQAAWAISTGLDAATEVAMAKAWVADAYKRVCAAAHQVHGAIGFTKEHDLQLYTRRAKAAEPLFGDAAAHRERVAEAIGLRRQA
jgi:alkylation response protein AidB-like acyl-CoA dehydrogenase